MSTRTSIYIRKSRFVILLKEGISYNSLLLILDAPSREVCHSFQIETYAFMPLTNLLATYNSIQFYQTWPDQTSFEAKSVLLC